MKTIFGRILCFFGRHDIEHQPSPEGIMKGIFGPYRCRRKFCNHHHKGFPYPDLPIYKIKESVVPGPVSDSYDPESRTYILGQIKAAFWDVFHESGEIWFRCSDSEEDNLESTEEYWNIFKDSLEDIIKD